MDKHLLSERRREERHQPGGSAFAAVEDTGIAGLISDISRGGLCFKYIDDPLEHKSGLPDDKVVSLVSLYSFVGYLRFKVVNDYPVLNVTPFSSMAFRKCHLQFDELNEQQLDELESYISWNVTENRID